MRPFDGEDITSKLGKGREKTECNVEVDWQGRIGERYLRRPTINENI
jgi:hypothetical protein